LTSELDFCRLWAAIQHAAEDHFTATFKQALEEYFLLLLLMQAQAEKAGNSIGDNFGKL
jgi:hypothetical protein